MTRKSEGARERRISATEASRRFSRILDRIETGDSYRVHRRGRDVCVMARPPVRARTASECLDLLRGRAPVLLDDGFSADLLGVVADEPVEERPSWGS